MKNRRGGSAAENLDSANLGSEISARNLSSEISPRNLDARKMKFSLHDKREFAKIGMTLSLATLIATSFMMKNGAAKKAHIISGALLTGFAVYHHSLYDKA